MKIGRLEIEIWKDTGKPLFRIAFSRCEVIYKWYFKIMSFYTLWIALRYKELK